MKAPGKSARTSPEEKTGAAPSVAKLLISPNGGRGELRALGGGKHDRVEPGRDGAAGGLAPGGPRVDHGGDGRGFARRSERADRYRSSGPGGRHAERPNDRGERRRA